MSDSGPRPVTLKQLLATIALLLAFWWGLSRHHENKSLTNANLDGNGQPVQAVEAEFLIKWRPIVYMVIATLVCAVLARVIVFNILGMKLEPRPEDDPDLAPPPESDNQHNNNSGYNNQRTQTSFEDARPSSNNRKKKREQKSSNIVGS